MTLAPPRFTAPAVAAAVAVAAAGVLCSACSSATGGNELSSLGLGVAAAPSRPVIGKLRTHDRSITLMASPGGLRVTVQDDSGAAIARDVDVEGLRLVDPLAYELCRSSVASNATYLDARR